MKILVNNREVELIEDALTVSQFLETMKLSFRMRIIKINGKLIPKDEYGSTIIHDGNDVQVIYLMSGG